MAASRGAGSFGILLLQGPQAVPAPRADRVFPLCQGSSNRDKRWQGQFRKGFLPSPMGVLRYRDLPDQSFPIPSVPRSVCSGYNGCLPVPATAASHFGGTVGLRAAPPSPCGEKGTEQI